MFLRPQDYERLSLALRSKKDFYLTFKLTEKINQVQDVIIFNKNNHFAVQFIPESVASAPLPDSVIPDVIVFVDK